MSPKEQVAKSLNYPLDIDDDQQMKTEILKPMTYFIKRRAMWKSEFFKFAGHWFKIPQDDVRKVSAILELGLDLYLAYDDILDASPLRHNIPSTYSMYGVAKTVLAIEYNFNNLIDMIEQLDEKTVRFTIGSIRIDQMLAGQLVAALLKEMPKVFAGLGLGIYWRRHNIVPTQEDDFHAAYLVFCGPTILGASVLSHRAAKKRDIRKILMATGFYLHVHDDYRNLHCTDYMKTKGFCDDIREGKCTVPIIHALNNFPEESQVIHQILQERTDSVEKKRQCLTILEKCGSFEYTKNIIDQIVEFIYEELDKIDDHPPMLRKYFETTAIPGLGTLS